MTEIKFACPVCGQHITVDSSSKGSQMECPTCFRALVVPTAATSPESKLLVAASEPGKPRPLPSSLSAPSARWRRYASRGRLAALLCILVLLGAGSAALHWYAKRPVPQDNLQAAHLKPRIKPKPGWTLDLQYCVIPDSQAAGVLRGESFSCERATLRGTSLTLREGRWPPESGVSVVLFSDRVTGKTLEVQSDRTPPLPHILLRWKDENGHATNRTFLSGYALQLSFGEITNNRLPGRIYLALPDEHRSYVAGEFEAQIVPIRSREDALDRKR